MFIELLLLLTCSLGCSHGVSSDNNEYNPMVVNFQLEILRLVNLNNATSEADFECVLKLAWNPWALKNFGSPTNPAVAMMWRPDIISYKSSSAEFSGSNVSYESGFDVTWTQKLHTRVSCEIEGPRKDRLCQISFTSRSHDMFTLSLRSSADFMQTPDDEISLEQSGYRIRNAGLAHSSREDPCCKKQVHVITFWVVLINGRMS